MVEFNPPLALLYLFLGIEFSIFGSEDWVREIEARDRCSPVSPYLLKLTHISHLNYLRLNFLQSKIDIMIDPPFLSHLVIVTIK